MAKKPSSPNPTSTARTAPQTGPERPFKTIEINKLIGHAEREDNVPPIYTNHIRITSSPNELFIDLFRVTPDPLDPTKVKATYLQRIIVPVQIAKGLTNALVQSVTNIEEALNRVEISGATITNVDDVD